jgi:serine/threonine-protein kinase
LSSFGRYEIESRLGEGAMGVVFRARDSALGRVVALKVLSADLESEEELQQRFQREAEAVGQLNHPNIVTVYDVGESQGQLYMAMELLEGEDLRVLIERKRDVTVPDRVRVMHQIALALGYAHSRGVVHRDIKPANILVTSSGRVKILDFGLARVSARSTITRQGVILGTPDYMSPEQAMGRPVDPRSDLFSAGSVFYEFLCGVKPFPGKTLHAVLYQIIQDEPEPLLTLNPEIPVRLAALVHGMMRKEPDKRPTGMDQVGRELKALHDALRRSHGRSALPSPAPPPGEEGRVRARERAARLHLESGHYAEAATEAEEALALEPDHEAAAEIAWRARFGRPAEPRPAARDEALEKRIASLLQEVSAAAGQREGRRARAELALIAPDDPRVLGLSRRPKAKAR